jgi:putative endopeptidase
MPPAAGRVTLGENIADLGGLTVAYFALQKALTNKPHTKIDGFTPEQRFFLAWAQSWRGLQRPEAGAAEFEDEPALAWQMARERPPREHARVP